MPKIPRQRTGSGGWPDRRRAVTYTGGKKGGGGGGKKGCVVVAIAIASVPLVLAYAGISSLIDLLSYSRS